MPTNKKWLTVTVIAILLAGGGGYYAYSQRASATVMEKFLLGQVKTGDVTKTVTATGSLQNNSALNLSFGAAGRLTVLNVGVGDTVKKGQVLAALDQKTLANQVASAQASLQSAQARLDALRQGPTAADIANLESQITRAQSDYENAQSNLKIAQQSVDATYLQTQIRLASDQLSNAQKQFDAASKTNDTAQITMAKTQLDQATKNYASAVQAASNASQAQTQLLNAQNTVRTTKAALDSAQAQLAARNQPPSSTDVAQAVASVQQAQASLANAQNNLEQATLVAPYEGVITASALKVGEQVSANTTVVSIQSSDSGMQLVVPVDEADIANLKLGQTASVTADSEPNVRFKATVEQIAPTGVTQSNVTTFPVTLKLQGDVSKLKVGQSMTASILVDQRKGVLIIPSEAIRGLYNKHSVLVYTSETEQPVATPVEIGIDDGINTEIKSGLTEGQQVVLGNRSGAAGTTKPGAATQGGRAGGFGGIGGGFGRGGRQ